MLRPTFPIVAVWWTDAAMQSEQHWQEGDVPDPPSGKIYMCCVTVGWLTYEDDDWVQLVATLTDGAHGHVTEIPRKMIHNIAQLAPHHGSEEGTHLQGVSGS